MRKNNTYFESKSSVIIFNTKEMFLCQRIKHIMIND